MLSAECQGFRELLSQQNRTKQTRDVTRRVHAFQPRPRHNTIHDAPHSHILQHSQTSHASTNTHGQTRARRVHELIIINEEIEETKCGAFMHRRHPPHQTWVHGTHRRAKKNHEYRPYKVRETVQRIWLYTTGATGAITCVPFLFSSLRIAINLPPTFVGT